MVEQFDDPYEIRIGIPVASWKYARVGEGIRGVCLPQKHNDGSERAYLLSQQVSIQGEPLWWNRPDGIQKARVQQGFLLGDVVNIKTGQPITLEDFISSKATERFDSAKQSGDDAALALIEKVGNFRLRRQIVKGESMEKGFRAAAQSIAGQVGPKPVVGIVVSIKLVKLDPNEHGGETKIYEVKFDAPTDESRAFVERYRSSLPQEGDPYPGADSTAEAHDEDPPF